MHVKSISICAACPILSVVLLTGCGHTASQSPSTGARTIPSAGRNANVPASGVDKSAPAISAPARKGHRPVIVAFGDSLTAGYGTNTGQSYPDYLQRDLDARGYRYRVINAGISGNTSKDGVVRLPEVVALHPAIAIIAFGGNDGLRGIPIEDTQMNLNTIVSTLQNAHATVILGGITLPPNYGPAYIRKFDAIYKNASMQYGVPLLPFMLKGAYGVPGDIQSDGIHATGKGNEQVAKNFLPLLLPLLRKSTNAAATQIPPSNH
jgi:acyl-CoA thioesterase I